MIGDLRSGATVSWPAMTAGAIPSNHLWCASALQGSPRLPFLSVPACLRIAPSRLPVETVNI